MNAGRCLLERYGLGLTDLHGSDGIERRWTATEEDRRRAGVELVRNRMELTAALGGDVIVMHIEPHAGDAPWDEIYWRQLFRSLDELRSVSKENGVRVAVELGQCDALDKVLANYEPEFVGFCYDTGHGNRRPDGPGWLEKHLDRLLSIHLQDNDKSGDQHRIPVHGSVDWPRVMGLVARSSYRKWVSLECSMENEPYADEAQFLRAAFRAAVRLAEMLGQYRAAT
jgi:sugar phosphate isomerase/epimerase